MQRRGSKKSWRRSAREWPVQTRPSRFKRALYRLEQILCIAILLGALIALPVAASLPRSHLTTEEAAHVPH